MADVSMNRRYFLTGNWRGSSATHNKGTIKIADICLARSGVTCMVCWDACPEDAIRFGPGPGRLFIPQVTNDRCTRCGDCAAVCPATAIDVAQTPQEVADA
ncbi:4Fe-4S dicluster domain-containing protein [Chelativorans xinjiangense]|uniref:4Fe-4S dicluster domain-containing protein n=1 Tax=Chelativorans xinjiangense TaxID=2681485 RepID=UPI0013588C39|nr:4Fe-4S dicluster domain-containing protein [Chelativorans xinjiangense]